MPSNHTGDPTALSLTVSFPTDGDAKHITPIRSALDVLLDNDAYLARRTFTAATLRLRRVATEGLAITDTAESLAAIQRTAATQLLAIKTAQALAVSAADFISVQGVPTQITSVVSAVATNGTQIVAIGTGGSASTFSADDGATWANAGAVGISGAGTRLVYSPRSGGVYVAARSSSTNVKFTDPTSVGIAGAWANLMTGVPAPQDLAAYDPDGTHPEVMVLSGTTTPAFYTSKSGGSLLSGTVANSGTADESGSLAGDGGTAVYHVFRRTSGTLLQVSSSNPTDVPAAAWTTRAVINAPTTLGFGSRPRIMVCQNTGLLVIVAPLTSTADAIYASADGGTTWTGPAYVYPGPGVNAYALAGGRLLCTRDDMLFATDGIGGF